MCARMRPDILIVSRARDADHASHLYQLGVTDAVPETVEASLQLSEAALVGLGVATGPVIASIHEKRDEIRHALQQAAREAGLERTDAVRPKRRKPHGYAAPRSCAPEATSRHLQLRSAAGPIVSLSFCGASAVAGSSPDLSSLHT